MLDAIAALPIASLLRGSGTAYLLVNATHILGLALLIGSILPLDLRLATFPVGRTVRAPPNHMQAILTRTAPDAFEMMVFRSMARTAWHELAEALEVLAARSRAG